MVLTAALLAEDILKTIRREALAHVGRITLN